MGIRFCTEMHLITPDNINPEQLDETALRSFLRSALHSFDELRKHISTEMTHCRSEKALQELKRLRSLSQQGHSSLKKKLPHLKTVNELFSFAGDAESILRYLTATAHSLEYPTKTNEFTAQIQYRKERLNDQCNFALSKMGNQLTKQTASAVQ